MRDPGHDQARRSACSPAPRWRQPDPLRFTPTEEGDVWYATVQQLVAPKAITARWCANWRLQSQLVARDGDQWLLRVERESLNQSGTARERLQAAALQDAGHAVFRLVVEVGA